MSSVEPETWAKSLCLVGLLSWLTSPCDFNVPFLGFLRELFPRPVMLARPSVFPPSLSYYDLSLPHCSFWHTQCLSSFVESRTMRSPRWTAMHFPDKAHMSAYEHVHKSLFITPKYAQYFAHSCKNMYFYSFLQLCTCMPVTCLYFQATGFTKSLVVSNSNCVQHIKDR